MKSAMLAAAMVGLCAPGVAQSAQQGAQPSTVKTVSRHPAPSGHLSRTVTATELDQTKTVQHFYLHDDGGTIEVSLKDPKDETSLDALRLHVSRLANRFADGEFAMPAAGHHAPQPAPAHSTHTMFGAHTAVPPNPDLHSPAHVATGSVSTIFIPGAATLSRLKGDVKYSYSQTDTGARVEIVTANPEAARAVHEFLRFQISEHRTGDLNVIVRRTY